MTSQQETTPYLQREEIIGLYVDIAYMSNVARDNPQLLNRDDLFPQPLDFLNELRPLIEQNTEDAQCVLRLLIRGYDEEYFRNMMTFHDELGTGTYKEVCDFLASLNVYIGKGMLGKYKKFCADPRKQVALYRVTEALREIEDHNKYHNGKNLGMSTNYGIDGSVVFIQNKELVTFVLENPQHGDAIADYLRAGGEIIIPAIDFAINGGSKSIASGAL